MAGAAWRKWLFSRNLLSEPSATCLASPPVGFYNECLLYHGRWVNPEAFFLAAAQPHCEAIETAPPNFRRAYD